MKIFLQKDTYEWDAVENGITIPMRDGKPKPVKELTTDEVNSLNYNARAMNSLLNGLCATELRKVSACTSAKLVWDTIVVSHEGTSKVREVKLDLLLSDYESFRLEKDESIKEAQGRFLTLMNSIALLERHIPQAESNRKILRSLPKKFAPKVTTLQYSALISQMETLTLFSELEEFENQLRRYDEEEEAPRKKTLALNADIDSTDDSDEEIALLTKRFQKFLAKKKAAARPQKQFNSSKFNSPKKETKNTSTDDACFECGKKGHFKKDCFKWKAKKASGSKEKKKSKALLTWSDDESDVEVDTDDELAQLCLAGIEEVSSDDEEVHSVTIPSNSEIPKDLLALQVQNRKLRDKNAYLKKALNEVLSEMDDTLKEESYAMENKLLSEKLAALVEENDSLKGEINKKDSDLAALREEANTVRESEKLKGITQQRFDELQKKIDLLKKDLAKFVHGEGTLDALLASQKSSLVKEGLGFHSGFNSIKKKAFGKGNKRSKMKYNMPYERCTDCNRKGHPTSKSILCDLKNHFANHFVRASPNIVEMWIKKSERHLYKIVDTNTAGPKMKWVPKI
ncbi:uncharacterized protein LOC135151372 [Daucus carota subsp. sativus]|uniref:uncharacterized protein LOC135151372 n=1 Tax=Daucus carota subsp. sativus TaxID=79200 RepID=UPI003082BBD1